MKKLVFNLVVLCFSLQISAQNVAVSSITSDWWPQLNQNANLPTLDGWYYRSNPGSERLAFDGNAVPGTSIATTFGSNIGAPYLGMTIKFDMTMPAPGSGKSSIIVLGSNAQWGGQGIVIEYTEFGVRAVKNFDYSAMTWMGVGSEYTTALGAGGLIAGNEINISPTGLITLKFGSYTCPTSYQADVNILNTGFVLVCPFATGFKFKNCLVTKGSNYVSYFPVQLSTALSATDKSDFSVSRAAGKGMFTIVNANIGETYQVINVVGQLVQSGHIKSEHHQIDLSNMPEGTYLLQTTEAGKSHVVKVVNN